MNVVVAIALAVLPLAVLRGRTLAWCYATSAAVAAFAWLLMRRLPFDPLLAAAAIFVVFLIFVATGSNVRWSANRAALIAAAVYAFAIPAMTRIPIDGDEPYYLLITESIVHDLDLDLANQYGAPTASGRTDLVPQLGDPVGAHGERYSRHEPFLPLLMVPGYALGGLTGAVATIALFGVLLVRSTIRWMEDEGIPADAARAVFPLFAFGPPVLFYAARIWPEVPAAFCFVEALRGIRARRYKRWLPALFGLVMLKLRFVLIAVALLFPLLGLRARGGAWPAGQGGTARRIAVALTILLVPIAVVWVISGSPLNVHSPRELLPAHPENYARGFFGLLLDGAAGIAFQAPFFLLGIFALTCWRETPQGFRMGLLASLLYLLYLLPRDEWHGGWSPPLRYVVFLMPVLALGAASVWNRISRDVVALIAVATAALAMRGLAFPWSLFHIFNGENGVGEWLSATYHSDFSRLFPSFIRVNHAAWAGSVALAAVLLLARLRLPSRIGVPLFALAIGFGFAWGRQPANTVHFEDAHVVHEGGNLYPPYYAPLRFAYRGGWVLNAGDSVSFLAREGRYTLHYVSGPGATIAIEGREWRLPPTNDRYATAHVDVPASRVTLRCLAGAVNLDRIDHD